jgi:hypothetical protein
VLAAALAQIEDLSKRRAAHDAAKQLEPAVVGMLREHGFQNSLLPHLLGGAELEPAEYIQVLEALARGDAATGWVTMTSSTSAMLGAYLPRTTANLLWSSATPMLAGVALAACGHHDDDRKPCSKPIAHLAMVRVDDSSAYMKSVYAHVGSDRNGHPTDPDAITFSDAAEATALANKLGC